MTVHIIIVGWNGDEWLPECMESLAAASTSPLHVILVDNHNNPCIPDLDLSAFRTTILKTPKPLGFAAANNHALVHANWDGDGLVLFLNQDTRSAPGWIDKCVQCFEQSPELGALSPGTRTLDDSDWDAAYKTCVLNAEEQAGLLWQKVDEVTAAAMIVRSSTLRTVGPFDPIFESYYEDYDLCRRIRHAGFSIGVCPEALLYHFNGSITQDKKAVARRMHWITRNRIISKIREAGSSRRAAVTKSYFHTLPAWLMRSALRRPNTPHPSIIFAVWKDLLALTPRLASKTADDEAWRAYLESINWPTHTPEL